jgi:hypothetical protein
VKFDLGHGLASGGEAVNPDTSFIQKESILAFVRNGYANHSFLTKINRTVFKD